MKTLIVLIVLCLVGCNPTQQEYESRMQNDIVYIKDHKTGLCFAHYQAGYGAGLAHVPCSAYKAQFTHKQGMITDNPQGFVPIYKQGTKDE